MLSKTRFGLVLFLAILFVTSGSQRILAQDREVETIVQHVRSQLNRRDSLLQDYTIQMDFSYYDYDDGDSTLEHSEKQKWIFRNGELVKRMMISPDSVIIDSAGQDSNQTETRSLELDEPLEPFQSNAYTFTLKESDSPEVWEIYTVPGTPSQSRYEGTYTIKKSDFRVLSADLEPSAKIPHVKEASFDVIFSTFRDFPVTATMSSRFRGKYLLFFSFDKIITVRMTYQ